jgi:hypothetical protein
MKKKLSVFLMLLLFTGSLFSACSDDRQADTKKEKEPGAIEKMTHETAQEAVRHMKEPIEKANLAKELEEKHSSDLEKAAKEK